jgi:3',5'-cyclic AMP phosphodiesterase CpdA
VGVALGALALVVALLALAATDRRDPALRTRTTLVATWIDRDGDGALERGPGEPLRDRTDLAPPARTRRTIATFGQISDAHVRDEESPGRLPVLDRFGAPYVSAFRPQEALTTHVLAATVVALNRVKPQAVAVTGDLVDNAQRNELEQALAVLRGGVVHPDSGRRGYDGVQAASNPDPFFYRPAVDAPRHPRLLAVAQRPFRSPGLHAPWYPAAGNHDLLTQGVVAATPRITRATKGSRHITELARGVAVPRSSKRVSSKLVDRLLSEGLGRSARTAPDPGRMPLEADDALARLRQASASGTRASRLDYVFDIGPRARAIVLDTARREAGSGGRIVGLQLDWLERELRRASDRLMVVFSHHPLPSSEGGEAALRLLDRDPRVVASISGHDHRNAIRPRRSRAGGIWLIETASLADFPQQARAFRLVETVGGGAALETWMLDHEGGALAGIARELSFLDAQGGRPEGSRGDHQDRNVRLHLGPRRSDQSSAPLRRRR